MKRIPQFWLKKQEINTEQGSIILWIFIIIGIFAALSYVVNQGSRSGAASLTKEQANMAATDVLNYANAIKRAVHTLQIDGCSDTEISFENPKVSGYANPNAPSDNSCHVFHPDGGGLSYIEPEEKWLDSTKSALAHYKTWFTSGKNWLTGIGTDGSGSQCAGGAADVSCRDLLTGIPYIKQEVCLSINKKLGWGVDDLGTPYKDIGSSYGAASHLAFSGTYTNGPSMGSATPSNYSNIMAGCIEGDTNPTTGSYSFFQVLIVR